VQIAREPEPLSGNTYSLQHCIESRAQAGMWGRAPCRWNFGIVGIEESLSTRVPMLIYFTDKNNKEIRYQTPQKSCYPSRIRRKCSENASQVLPGPIQLFCVPMDDDL
jgi:hypothetical protein